MLMTAVISMKATVWLLREKGEVGENCCGNKDGVGLLLYRYMGHGWKMGGNHIRYPIPTREGKKRNREQESGKL